MAFDWNWLETTHILKEGKMQNQEPQYCIAFPNIFTIYCYNSMSLASSSEKSDIELSEEEERSSWENNFDYIL